MNRKILNLIRMSILFIVLNFPTIFAQQCYIYPGYKWPVNTVTYHINGLLGDAFASQEDYKTAIKAAASSWSAAGSVFRFNKGDDVYYDKGQEPNGIYQVGYYNDPTPDPNGKIPLALTLTSVDNNNQIVKVETYFNKYWQFSIDPNYTQYDIQSLILHEFGHWLYLGDETDPEDCSDNVMFQGLTYHQIKRDLTTDDKNGIIKIYGQDGISQLKLNPFLNRHHYFFSYEPKVLFYINSETVNKRKTNKTNLPKSPENKLYTTPKPEAYLGEIKKEGNK